MTQLASSRSIVAPWDGVQLKDDRYSLILEKRDEQFWVKLEPSPAPSRIEPGWQRVFMTTGSHHRQVYWLQAADGAFSQLPWLYHIDGKRWQPTNASFLQPESHTADTKWVSCSQCHTTDPSPGSKRGEGINSVVLTALFVATNRPGDRY